MSFIISTEEVFPCRTEVGRTVIVVVHNIGYSIVPVVVEVVGSGSSEKDVCVSLGVVGKVVEVDGGLLEWYLSSCSFRVQSKSKKNVWVS